MEQFKHIDINKQDENGNTLLMRLCKNSDIPYEMVEILLIIGADPNIQNKTGIAALSFICDSNSNINKTKLIKLLCSYNANVNLCNKNGSLPLHYICKKSYEYDAYNDIQILIENGSNLNDFASDVNCNIYYTPLTLLYCANMAKNLEKNTKMMIENGADVKILDCNGLSIIDTMFVHNTYYRNRTCDDDLKNKLQILLELGSKINGKYLLGYPRLVDIVVDYQNKRIEELESAFKFIPGNEGMLEAKKEFEEHSQKQDKKIEQ